MYPEALGEFCSSAHGCAQAFMNGAGKEGVLLVSLGTVVELGEPLTSRMNHIGLHLLCIA